MSWRPCSTERRRFAAFVVSVTAFVGCAASGSTADTTTVASTAPSTFPPLPTTTVPATPRVLILGDFLTRDAEGLGLADSIGAIGWEPVVDTAEDRTIAQGADSIDLLAGSGALPTLTLISLGANDACGGSGPIDVDADVARIASHADAEHVIVWVNLQMRDCMARARAINESIVRAAFTNPDFRVADWATDAPSNLLEGDGIHYKRSGSEFRIDYYVSLIRMHGRR